jgi:hypothetical protein
MKAIAFANRLMRDLKPVSLTELSADARLEIVDAINAAIHQEKFALAAQALCGPQAAWQQLNDGSVQCRTKHGKPTITVQVSP